MAFLKTMAVFAGCGMAASAVTGAHGQIWIGQIVGNMIAQQQAAEAERLCMTGTPMPNAEIDEARKPAVLTMAGYWGSVSRAQPANVSAHFHLTNKARWVSGTTVMPMARLVAVSDPFAAQRFMFDAVPIAFVRAGDGASAAGQWAVRGDNGKRTGVYQARFTRAAGVWRLAELELFGAAHYVDPLVQYCHKRDDVMPYRLTSADAIKTYAVKRATKAQAKADTASAAALKAQAQADTASGPGKSTKMQLAALASTKAQEAQATAARRKTEADAAIVVDLQAKADAAAMAAARASGIAALTGQ